MKLRGIDFGPILGASGVQGFFGEGYFHHKFLRPFGLDFEGCTFVAKTTTLEKREGNMPMEKDGITPKELLPKCVKVKFLNGVMLNSVGLSGPGAKALFEDGRWYERTNPFFLSFMSVEKSSEERIAELERFVKLFAFYYQRWFNAKVGLQINYSCPNVGLDPNCLVSEVKTGLKIASTLNVPLMPKFNILVPISAAREISQDPHCDAICVLNTIPWGKLPDRINWKKLFGSDVSPLVEFGGGGLSGRPLLPLVCEWVSKFRCCCCHKKPINAGGGILLPSDLTSLHLAGASSVFIGSVATLRPWRVKQIIEKAYQLF
jgi:dihydroorotate dehydrogenase